MTTRDGRPPFKRNIRAFLERTGMSMRALSIKAGLAPDTVKGILGDKSTSSREDTLRALAAAMETTYSDLVGESAVGLGDTGAPVISVAGYGARLAAARQKLGLEQSGVAGRLGVDRARVAMWEAEEIPPDFLSLARLAALGISIDLVLAGRPGASAERSRIGPHTEASQECTEDPYLPSFIEAWKDLSIEERAAWAALLDTQRRKSAR